METKSLLALLLSIFSLFASANTKEIYEKFIAGKAVIIDVREDEEVKEGMIKGARWFPLSKIEANKKEEIEKVKSLSKNKEIFLYCRSGKRSGKYQDILKEAGVRSQNIGGYTSLVKDGLPTQSGP